jgi:hypothetical protein
MSKFGATSVTMVGHSLGAAISLLDSVYLPLHLPSGTTFRTTVYGLPRVSINPPSGGAHPLTAADAQVGNQAFANYIDAHTTLTHINNKEDPVPILPGRFLGFHHPSGEVHIQDSGAWDACPGTLRPPSPHPIANYAFCDAGQDNTSDLCIVGDVPNIFESNESDHDGPYDGVEMGC